LSLTRILIAQLPDLEVYHADLSEPLKKILVKELTAVDSEEKRKVVLTTSALGMGINIRMVRWVILLGDPPSVLEMTQMMGRAGRDKRPSRATLLVRKTGNVMGWEDYVRSLFVCFFLFLRKEKGLTIFTFKQQPPALEEQELQLEFGPGLQRLKTTPPKKTRKAPAKAAKTPESAKCVEGSCQDLKGQIACAFKGQLAQSKR